MKTLEQSSPHESKQHSSQCGLCSVNKKKFLVFIHKNRTTKLINVHTNLVDPLPKKYAPIQGEEVNSKLYYIVNIQKFSGLISTPTSESGSN